MPFIMYADFESILNPTESSEPNPEESYTTVINQHIGIFSVLVFQISVLESYLDIYLF